MNKNKEPNGKQGKKSQFKMPKKIMNKILTYIKTLKIVLPILILFVKKIKLKKMHIFLKVSSDDAKNCAITYSHLYSLFENILNIFDLRSKVKDLRIKIIPDFISSEMFYSGEIILSTRLLDIFLILIYSVLIMLRNIKSLRE